MELQWPLILFTTLLAWSAGVFGAQCIYLLRGQGKKAQMPALIVSAILLVVGGIAVFFHLEHWERIFNGFGHLTSGITQELIAIVVLFIAMIVYFVYLRRSGDDAEVPVWLAVIGLVLSVILVVVMGHSYMMVSRPAWESVIQVGSLLGAACGFGPATMAIITAMKDEALDYNGKINIIGQIINLVLVVAYLLTMQMVDSYTSVQYWFDPTSPTQDITGEGATEPFAGASLGCAIAAIVAAVVGLLSAFLGKSKGDWKVWGSVGVVCVLISALCLRTVFYMTGVSIYPFF